MKIKPKICDRDECKKSFVPRFKSTEKHCSSYCFYNDPKTKKSITKKSKKVIAIDKRYTPMRREFLSKPENNKCAINGTNCTKKANTIEHSKGRGDYFVDDYAEQNNIPLTLDLRFWLPACLNCNLELENNDELSQAHQLSKIHNGKKLKK